MRGLRKAIPSNDENIKLMVQELEGDGISRFAVNKISRLLMKPEGWTAPVINVPYPTGVPPKSLMIKIADASYEVSPPKEIEGWELIKATRTLKFYKKGSIILVGIRGTADGRDFMADLKIATGDLVNSSRYKQDLVTMKQVFNENPTETFYGVGHSLGAALLDLFIQAGYIEKGISYNGAVEQAFFNSTRNYRIYMENDPLYNLIGQYSRLGEVRKQRSVSSYDAIGTAQSIKAHLLSNFKGGKMNGGADIEAPPPPPPNQPPFKREGYEPSFSDPPPKITINKLITNYREVGMEYHRWIWSAYSIERGYDTNFRDLILKVKEPEIALDILLQVADAERLKKEELDALDEERGAFYLF